MFVHSFECLQRKLVIYFVCTSERELAVPAALLQEHTTNAYISSEFYCPKAYHRPNGLTYIIEYYRKIIISEPNIFAESRTEDSF
jgi:hypothetical protein